MLELAEEALDEIALAIDASTDRALDQSLAGGRDMGLGAASLDHVQESVGIIAAVGHDIAAFESFQQKRCNTSIMSLSGR